MNLAGVLAVLSGSAIVAAAIVSTSGRDREIFNTLVFVSIVLGLWAIGDAFRPTRDR